MGAWMAQGHASACPRLPHQPHRKYPLNGNGTSKRREGSGASTQHSPSRSMGVKVDSWGLSWGQGATRGTGILQAQHGHTEVMAPTQAQTLWECSKVPAGCQAPRPQQMAPLSQQGEVFLGKRP